MKKNVLNTQSVMERIGAKSKDTLQSTSSKVMEKNEKKEGWFE
jgi:hypothetical protein